MIAKKILVSGGAGFIGSHIVSQLTKVGHRVVVLDSLINGNKLLDQQNPDIQLIIGDVRDRETVFNAAKGCQLIIHLAAIVGVDEVIDQSIEMVEIETIGTNNIVNAAIHHGIKKIIYASSSAVYHDIQAECSREEDTSNLVNTYAIAKGLNERYLTAITEKYGISTNSVRLFNVYGTRQDTRMVIPKFFKQAMNQQAIEVFGDGNQTRDFTHIDDVVKGILLLSNRQDLNGIFNIARGNETTIKDLARIIQRITKSKAPVQLIDFPELRIAYKVNKRVGCTQKLLSKTGFAPQISLVEGLQRLYLEILSISSSKV